MANVLINLLARTQIVCTEKQIKKKKKRKERKKENNINRLICGNLNFPIDIVSTSKVPTPPNATNQLPNNNNNPVSLLLVVMLV